MELSKNIGIFEITILGVFIFLYVGYLIRIRLISKELKSSMSGVLPKLILRTLYMLLFLVAFLGPTFGEMKKEIKAIGKDIYIMVDLSQSMDATDISPSRIEKVKYELKNLVEAFKGDRLGLIIFSGDAFMQCPLTFDTKAIMLFIETLNTNLISNSGTDFYPPLTMVLDKFAKEDEKNKNFASKQQTKIAILISDGEDFGDETISVANQVADAGIKLFTLGVGTERGSKIPQGYRFKRDQQGNEVISKINSDALKKLASLTNGKYFEISDNRNDMTRLINYIGQIEGEMRNTKKVDAKANKYYYFLFFAFVLMCFDVLMTVKVLKI
ncbi:MAG: VWA domain-containing protein [Flammeovirgaceae bacterium]